MQRALDQLAVSGEGRQGLLVAHGRHRGAPQSPVALATGVEQALAAQRFKGLVELSQGWWMLGDIDQLQVAGLHRKALLGEPLQGFAASATCGVAVDPQGGAHLPMSDFSAPTRLLEPLPTPS